ncbi:MAG: DUF1330 domain-containing protein [Alphaproteobacteria bacterium]|nr:DUF1330 domain-containing protein [Alphaproteobacteria bacterium]MBV8411410.1 DUF1330 domain-containing protein [Alphaproteobacteria bacterium]
MHCSSNRLLSLGVAFVGMMSAAHLSAQPAERPAFVIVERTATTGPESIQEDYAKLAREILPKYGAKYLARSQRNALLEGEGTVPCCVAILEFPSMDAVKRWYDSPENRDAAKVRQSGAKFRLVAIEGLPSGK